MLPSLPGRTIDLTVTSSTTCVNLDPVNRIWLWVWPGASERERERDRRKDATTATILPLFFKITKCRRTAIMPALFVYTDS